MSSVSLPSVEYSMLGKPASVAHTLMTNVELALVFRLLLAHLLPKV